MQEVWINGVKSDQIGAADRGICYGDGLFETIAIINGQPQLLAQHLHRLSMGFSQLGFPEALIDQVASKIKDLTLDGNQVLKVTVTRGEGARGYAPPEHVSATIILSLSRSTSKTENTLQGVSLTQCRHQLPINPALAKIKHLNRLDQVLARSEWTSPDIVEGVVTDTEGFVVEGTMSNIFWVGSKGVVTPLIDRCGVQGVMRDHLIKLLSKESVDFKEGRYKSCDLLAASEVFICNSLIGIWPVVSIGNQHYDIGPLTRKLQTLLAQELK